MTTHQPLPFVFGGGYFNPGQAFGEPEAVQEILKALLSHKINTIDTAQLYGKSEQILGENGAHEMGFILDSKNPGGANPGKALQPDYLEKTAYESVKKLGVEGKGGLDIFYVHAQDDSIPVETWMPSMDKLHKAGVFQRLGVSNFTAEAVRKVYDFAEKNDLVKPTVYQGNFNALARHVETTLIPTLRELKISFYAYSPVAGGFLTKKLSQAEAGEGRFNKDAMAGAMYMHMYTEKPSMMKALATWNAIADKEGISNGELCYRWITYHSSLKPQYGDKLITGAKSVAQLDQMVKWVEKGPLSEDSVKGIDEMWENVKADAFEHNLQAHASMQKSGDKEGADKMTDPDHFENK